MCQVRCLAWYMRYTYAGTNPCQRRVLLAHAPTISMCTHVVRRALAGDILHGSSSSRCA